MDHQAVAAVRGGGDPRPGQGDTWQNSLPKGGGMETQHSAAVAAASSSGKRQRASSELSERSEPDTSGASRSSAAQPAGREAEKPSAETDHGGPAEAVANPAASPRGNVSAANAEAQRSAGAAKNGHRPGVETGGTAMDVDSPATPSPAAHAGGLSGSSGGVDQQGADTGHDADAGADLRKAGDLAAEARRGGGPAGAAATACRQQDTDAAAAKAHRDVAAAAEAAAPASSIGAPAQQLGIVDQLAPVDAGGVPADDAEDPATRAALADMGVEQWATVGPADPRRYGGLGSAIELRGQPRGLQELSQAAQELLAQVGAWDVARSGNPATAAAARDRGEQQAAPPCRSAPVPVPVPGAQPARAAAKTGTAAGEIEMQRQRRQRVAGGVLDVVAAAGGVGGSVPASTDAGAQAPDAARAAQQLGPAAEGLPALGSDQSITGSPERQLGPAEEGLVALGSDPSITGSPERELGGGGLMDPAADLALVQPVDRGAGGLPAGTHISTARIGACDAAGPGSYAAATALRDTGAGLGDDPGLGGTCVDAVMSHPMTYRTHPPATGTRLGDDPGAGASTQQQHRGATAAADVAADHKRRRTAALRAVLPLPITGCAADFPPDNESAAAARASDSPEPIIEGCMMNLDHWYNKTDPCIDVAAAAAHVGSGDDAGRVTGDGLRWGGEGGTHYMGKDFC